MNKMKKEIAEEKDELMVKIKHYFAEVHHMLK